MSNNTNKNRNNKNSYVGIAVFALIMLINIAGTSAGAGIIAVIIVVAAVAAVIGTVLFIIKKGFSAGSIKNGKGEKFKAYLSREEESAKDLGFQRREPVIYSYDENAQERNFIRDRERRLGQLEGFLKNGIIEKEEYLILKSKYLKEKL